MSTFAELTQAAAMALGRVPSGLAILTVARGDRETGMLVSWVQQCSFEPPQISIAVRRGRDVLGWLEPGTMVTVNLLGEGQTQFLSHFGKGFALDQPAFTGLQVDRMPGLAPILLEAMGYLVARIDARHTTGDHELIIATVEGGRMLKDDGKPMVHVRKNGLRY